MKKNDWGISHLSQLPTTVAFALIILVALLGLALLRHLSVRVEA